MKLILELDVELPENAKVTEIGGTEMLEIWYDTPH